MATGAGHRRRLRLHGGAPAQNPALFDGQPYVVALVELAEGVRMMTNVVGCDPAEVVVGMPVSVTWEQLSDGRNLPQFQPQP